MKKRRINKYSALLIAALLLFSTCSAAFAESINVTFYGTVYSYLSNGDKPDENMHGKFTASNGKPVFCAEHGINAPTGEIYGASKLLDATEYDNTQIRKILFYGYKGVEPWSGFSSPIYNGVYKIGFSGNYATDKTDACGTAVTSMALTKAYGKNGRWYNVSGLSDFEKYIESKPDPKINAFKTFFL